MASALDVIPIRRALGLTDQPLRKNEKTGVGQAQIVLSQDTAAKIFLVRVSSPSLPLICQEIAGKSAMVAEVFSVSPKTVRDIWGRKTWTQATRSLWTEKEILAHSGESGRNAFEKRLPIHDLTKGKKDENKQARRPRGRPQGSKDSRPRKRRLNSEEEGAEYGHEDGPKQLEAALSTSNVEIGREYTCKSGMMHKHSVADSQGMPHRLKNQAARDSRFAVHDSSQRRGGQPPHKADLDDSENVVHMAKIPLGGPSSHPLEQQNFKAIETSSALGLSKCTRISMALFETPMYSGSFDLDTNEDAFGFDPLDGDDYGSWMHFEICSGESSDDGDCGAMCAFGQELPESSRGLWQVGERSQFQHDTYSNVAPAWPFESGLRPSRHGMTLRSAMQPSAQARIITEAAAPHRITCVNEAWCDMCQYRPEEVRGMSPKILQGPLTNTAALKSTMEKVILQGWPEATCTVINYKKSGEAFVNMLTLKPLYDDDNTISHYMGVLVEISS